MSERCGYPFSDAGVGLGHHSALGCAVEGEYLFLLLYTYICFPKLNFHIWWLRVKNLLSHSSEGQKSEIKVSAGLRYPQFMPVFVSFSFWDSKYFLAVAT